MKRLLPFHLAPLACNLMNAAFYQEALHSVAAPIVIFDDNGMIIWCNLEFTLYTAYEFSDLQYNNIAAILEVDGATATPVQRIAARSKLVSPDERRVRLIVRRADRSAGVAEADVRAMQSDGLASFFVCVLHDATATERALQRERERSSADPLTGVFCKAALVKLLHDAIEATRGSGQVLALLFIDLDGFKEVNDQHGHSVGDDVLRAVASRLQSAVRASDIVGRYGGDEFVIVLPALAGRQQAYEVSEKLLEQLAQPFSLGRVTARIGASVGVAFFPDHGNDVRSIMTRADEAMYRGKRGGGGTVAIARNLCSLVSREPRCRAAPVVGVAEMAGQA